MGKAHCVHFLSLVIIFRLIQCLNLVTVITGTHRWLAWHLYASWRKSDGQKWQNSMRSQGRPFERIVRE